MRLEPQVYNKNEAQVSQ